MSGTAISRARCLLFAYHEMGYACMEALLGMGVPVAALFTHTDAPGEEIWWRSCAELARCNGIPVHTPERLGDSQVAQIQALRPDVIYSFYYRHLLPAPVLEAARLGSFNLHGSLLPGYRGRAPVNWMLANGESEGGVTLHCMVERADAGDIVGQRAVTIDAADTALTLSRKLVALGVELLRECHPLIAAGRAPRLAQDLAAGSYFGRRRPEDGRIDWNWPARRIYNLVRAVTHPYPGAFCLAGGRKLFVWQARMVPESSEGAAPGTILRARHDDAVEVASGAGSLLLVAVQFEGESEGLARAVLGAGFCGRGARLN